MSFPFDLSTLPSDRGCRYFVRCGATTHYARGFKSRQELKLWILDRHHARDIEWQAGYLLKFYDDERQVHIVDRKGKEPRS